MIFTDTHSHLYLKAFDEDRSEVVQRAINAGVQKIVIPNIDSSSIEGILSLQKQFPENCFPAMGLHPGSVKENFEEELKLIKSCLEKDKYYAIGEIGLDYYWDKKYVDQQKAAFKTQLKWAVEEQLPVIIHCRKAFAESISIVKEFNNLKGIFHCFSGTLEEAKAIIKQGFYIGIGGVVTFKNAGLADVVRQLPPEKIVLETDAPYLAPVPYRGKRNESAYLVYIAEKIAELHKITPEKVADITTQNSKDIFNI